MAITIDEIKTFYPPAADLTDAQINMAIAIVDEISAEYLAPCGYTPEMQHSIELYLAAHFLQVNYASGVDGAGSIIRKRTGESEEQYRAVSNDAKGLMSTIYGQQGLALDFKGCLTPLVAQSIKAQFRVI
tara:strand:+ start:415 stop:804 length:390 start_codon:yes stop_codon:yes gene_type:complete